MTELSQDAQRNDDDDDNDDDKMKQKLSILLILILFLGSCNVRKQLAKADLMYESGEYFNAVNRYKKVNRRLKGKENKQLKGEVNYKMGICYWRLSDFQRSAKCMQTAIKSKTGNDTALLYLGKAMLAQQRYKEASTAFHAYLIIDPDNQEAQEGLQSVEQMPKLKKGFTRYRLEEFKHFNSRKNSDFCPMFVGMEDDNIVMFTSNRNSSLTGRKNKKKEPINGITGVADNDLYMCHRNKAGKWETVTTAQGAINTSEDDGVCCFTRDGRTCYFTHCDANRAGGQIFKAQRSGMEWTEPVEVKLFDDSTITVGHPALNENGNRLYFVTDNSRGTGGRDIWFADQLEDGSWGIPSEMPAPINTKGDEMFPYVFNDTTLYFASNGHVGLGGLDLYVATCDTAGHWTVHNLLAPMNSPSDDFGITFNSTRNEGFFSSNRNQRKAIDRIYHFFFDPIVYAIEGKIVDEAGQPVSEAIIRLVGDNGDIIKSRAKMDGTYSVNLTVGGARYAMMASKRGYLNASYKFNTFRIEGSKLFTNDFTLVSLNKAVKMDNIFYEFGKWTLTPESEAGLKSLMKVLTDNPNITIEISAHTDMVGSEESNNELSFKRAQSVVNWLIASGIDPARITPKGYGESKPVVVSSELAKQYKFLKEGDELTPEFIMNLKSEQQEICNQINRRTEFKVLKTTYKLY